MLSIGGAAKIVEIHGEKYSKILASSALATMTSKVTFTLDTWSWNVVQVLSRYQVHLLTKYEVNPFIGLRGVCEQTHIYSHTDRGA